MSAREHVRSLAAVWASLNEEPRELPSVSLAPARAVVLGPTLEQWLDLEKALDAFDPLDDTSLPELHVVRIARALLEAHKAGVALRTFEVMP